MIGSTGRRPRNSQNTRRTTLQLKGTARETPAGNMRKEMPALLRNTTSAAVPRMALKVVGTMDGMTNATAEIPEDTEVEDMEVEDTAVAAVDMEVVVADTRVADMEAEGMEVEDMLPLLVHLKDTAAVMVDPLKAATTRDPTRVITKAAAEGIKLKANDVSTEV